MRELQSNSRRKKITGSNFFPLVPPGDKKLAHGCAFNKKALISRRGKQGLKIQVYSLRWHYPDQLWSKSLLFLSAGSQPAPVFLRVQWNQELINGGRETEKLVDQSKKTLQKCRLITNGFPAGEQ